MNEHVAFKVPANAYHVDVYAWTQSQAELMRSRRLDLIDVENIIEEIESLGNEQIHAVRSHLVVLGEHLIKLLVSADQNPRRGWKRSVREARRQIRDRIETSLSLRPKLPELVAEGWKDMIEEAIDGLRTDEERTYALLLAPFTPADMLDPDFFPGG